MFDPVSTYRIQFHKEFNFAQFKGIIPYLHELGVRTIYASPIFTATPGSMHGYDVTDPLNINPEIGTLDELRDISKRLNELDISWLQDIVPNHMAYHPDNAWLMDVLEHGRSSEYADFFDIEWESPVYSGRLMVPFLGLTFEEAVAQKQIKIVGKEGKLWLTYFDQSYPLCVDGPEKYTASYIKKVNADAQLLKEIAEAQAYQLCHWQETDRQINYRRFFTVNGLICLNMQNERVFAHYHQFIKQLLDENIFQGLRVDHIDGLYDPEGYLKMLRDLAGADTYITVEKILETGEAFPAHWPVQGNTGYDFLGMVNNLFTRSTSGQLFTDRYEKLVGKNEDIEASTHVKKEYILKQHMAGELDNLYRLFKNLRLANENELANVNDTLKDAIAKLLIYCPIYRYYGNSLPLSIDEANAMTLLIDEVVQTDPTLTSALQLLKTVLIDRAADNDLDYNDWAIRFFKRCMQFTGPLMAKGVEDTLMYTYNRFIGHNEVGDSPASFGMSIDAFHQLMVDRRRNWPLSINGTSTHDTKRGEDVRARLNVLTDLPEEWFALVKKWGIPNGIDPNDAYFIYQSIIGAHPMPETAPDDFTQRMQDYLIKALREGKQSSDWAQPNEPYEASIKTFIADILEDGSYFRKTFTPFHRRVADHGIVNSLSQVLLKFTSPGIPDVYQGCELWDLSLVDPDNRRPVNYKTRSQYIGDLNWQQLWESRYNGQVKLTLTNLLLKTRSVDERIFVEGSYIPLNVTGRYAANVFAFARQLGTTWYVTALPLHLATLKANGAEPSNFDWEDTAITLPPAAPSHWHNVLTDDKGYAGEGLSAKVLFATLPVALVKLQSKTDRGAGVLLHVSSLPSAFGAGDIGPEAYRFIDFLFESGQRYWQMLPVNPVDKGAGYSPYSATSSLAGNQMLISPEQLLKAGWLNEDDISGKQIPATNRADLDKAVALRSSLLNVAYERFISSGDENDFVEYKFKEDHWLHDFALYQVLKQLHQNKPWYRWPKELKNRNAAAIKKINNENAVEIDKEKWLQFIFSKQWQELRSYAELKGITLFGDMPFYISYDSVDVWSRPEFFKLDNRKSIAGIAGVPPDYFSAEGQLWGMPVFNWDNLKKDKYGWWLQRIRKNLEYFNLIRLDHFRAFTAYWEVSGGETTAINGKWMPGPGADLFKAIKAELGHLPFVAEDLGDIDEDVHSLRDEFKLPGMRVLQFAFGNDMPGSDHIPHQHTQNSFVYTGTHDNNTTRGWYTQDADSNTKKNIERYADQKVSEKNVCEIMIRLCYASVAKVAILPVQDILSLDASHRMNVPSSAEGNWTWRMATDQLDARSARRLAELTVLYGR